MQDYSNNAPHFLEPDGSLEPTLTPELVAKGFRHDGARRPQPDCNALRRQNSHLRGLCLASISGRLVLTISRWNTRGLKDNG